VTVGNLTYINLEPGNGGMILNVSVGGLGFCAALPVQKDRPLHFRLSEPNLRIEADAEVAWSDETNRKGGMRFTNLSAEARRQIHNWMSQPTPVGVDRRCAPVAHPCESSSASAVAAEASVISHSKFASLKDELRNRCQGFSGGLATGLLLSALIGGAFLLNSHHREFGEVLVHWGERLGAGAPQTVSVETHTQPAPERIAPSAASLPQTDLETQPEAPMSQTLPAIAKREPAKREFDAKLLAPIRPSAGPPGDGDKATLNPEALSPVLLPESLLATPAEPSAFVDAHAPIAPKAGPRSTSNTNRVETSLDAVSAPPPERYLEVGKFKKKMAAEETKRQMAQLGLPTVLAQKGRVWTNSYYVLVGPYGKDREIERAKKELVSRGFQPRVYDKGSRAMMFPSRLALNGASLPCGLCTISWEAYEPNAAVTFQAERSGSMQAEGKLVRRNLWYDGNAFVYRINPDGSRSLLEIRLGSTNQALVFGEAF
jgi:cell division protein FtsN